MGEDGVPHCREGHLGQHSGLDDGRDFPRFGTDHGASQDAVVVGVKQCFKAISGKDLTMLE
jgi:hypothetical protein